MAEWLPAVDGASDSKPEPNPRPSEHRPSLPSPKPAVVAEDNTVPSAATQSNTAEIGDPSSDNSVSAPDYTHEWMAGFCVEPPNDGETCALGTFVPCVLMSKTDWRFNQLQYHADPLDSSWKSNYGCNPSCFILGLAVTIFAPAGFCVLSVYALRQRLLARHFYEIHGNYCQDCAISFFCVSCSIIQVDREIRAREGETRLRTNKKYILEPVVTQPALVEPMRYISPRPIQECEVSAEKLQALKKKGRTTQVAMFKRQIALKNLGFEEMIVPSNIATPDDDSRILQMAQQENSKKTVSASNAISNESASQPPKKILPEGSYFSNADTEYFSRASERMSQESSNLSNANNKRNSRRNISKKFSNASIAGNEHTSQVSEKVLQIVSSNTEKNLPAGPTSSTPIVNGDSFQAPETALQDKSNRKIELIKHSAPKDTADSKASSNEKPMIATLWRISRELKNSISGKPKNIESSINEAELNIDTHKACAEAKGDHNLTDCAIPAIPELKMQDWNSLGTSSKVNASTSKAQQHDLLDSNTVAARSSITILEHDLGQCTTTSPRPSMAVLEHDLQECSAANARLNVAASENVEEPIAASVKHSMAIQEHELEQCLAPSARPSIVIAEHDLGECPAASARLSLTIPEHDLGQCIPPSPRPSVAASDSGQRKTTATNIKAANEQTFTDVRRVSSIRFRTRPQHRLSSCITTASDPGSYIHNFKDYPIKNRGVEYYEKNPTLSIYSRVQKRFSSYLATASEHSEPCFGAHTPELSYYHDFTDCPVNKEVLEYYEREEKRIRELEANDSGPQGSEHLLSGCSTIDGIPQRKSSREARSESCCSMVDEIRRQRTGSNRVVSCPGATASSDKIRLREHRIDSCPSFPSYGSITHRDLLKPRLDSRALPPLPSFDDSNIYKGKGMVNENESEELEDDTRRRSSFNHAIDIIATAVNSLKPKPDEAKANSNVKKGKAKKRKNKGKGKAVEVEINQNEKPRQDSAQVALEKLLVSASPEAKKQAAANIDNEQLAQRLQVDPDEAGDIQADEGEGAPKSGKRQNTWGDTLGKIFGEAKNPDIGG